MKFFRIAERERELNQLRYKLANKSNNRIFLIMKTLHFLEVSEQTNSFPSLNGATPINTLSFAGCITSTPINDMVGLKFFIFMLF